MLLTLSSAWGADPDGLWGPERGCLRGRFTRDEPMAQKAREIARRDQDEDFSLRFRFRTLGRGSYGAVAYVGIHDAESPWNANGAGVLIFRHSTEKGLVSSPFLWDSSGENHQGKGTVALEYDTAYDVECVYSGTERQLRLTIRDTLSGEAVGGPVALKPPADIKWSGDRLACWNHADGHSPNMALTVLIDRLQLDDGTLLDFAADLSELPLGDASRFSWHQMPVEPLIADLTAPREVGAGRDGRSGPLKRPSRMARRQCLSPRRRRRSSPKASAC